MVKGSVASTSTWPWVAPFSLEESLGAGGSLVGSEAFSLTDFLSLSAMLARSASLEGSVRAVRVLVGAT